MKLFKYLYRQSWVEIMRLNAKRGDVPNDSLPPFHPYFVRYPLLLSCQNLYFTTKNKDQILRIVPDLVPVFCKMLIFSIFCGSGGL